MNGTEQVARTVGYSVREVMTKDKLTYSTVTTQLDPVRFTIDKAEAAVALPVSYLEELKINRQLYYGNHWLDGNGWKGPWPMPATDATKDEEQALADLYLEIIRGFTPRNVIAEVDERHANGVVGIEPRWSWTPDGIKVRTPRQLRRPNVAQLPPATPKPTATDPNPTPAPAPKPPAATDSAAADALTARCDTLNSQVTKWWDDSNCHDVFQQYTRAMLYGRVVSLRVHIPASALESETVQLEDGTKKATGRKILRVTDVDDAFRKIHVEVIDGDEGRVVRDRITMADIGVRLAKRNEQSIAHVTYLDENGKTIMAVVDQSSGAGEGQTLAAGVDFDLGGRLLMHTSVREAFITEQVRQAQYALNYANSVIVRNNTTAGFQETILTNTKLEGVTTTLPNGRKKFIPDPVFRGPTVLNVLQGHQIEDGQGNTTMTTPGVHDRQPVDPTPTIKSKREHYRDILEECDQVHVLMDGDAIASGTSRIQARADHISSMMMTQSNVQRAGRWLIETVTAFAYALASSGRSGADAVAGLRVSFQCLLDAGPLDASERAQNTTDVGAGTLSVETCIERNGINDVDEELERIADARAVDMETKRAGIFAAWIAAGADETFAGYRAGLSPAEIERLMEAFTPPTVPPDPNATDPNATDPNATNPPTPPGTNPTPPGNNPPTPPTPPTPPGAKPPAGNGARPPARARAGAGA